MNKYDVAVRRAEERCAKATKQVQSARAEVNRALDRLTQASAAEALEFARLERAVERVREYERTLSPDYRPCLVSGCPDSSEYPSDYCGTHQPR